MSDPIYVGNGILDQIKNFGYHANTITKESVFNYWIDRFKELNKEYSWDYEKFLRDVLHYAD